jgi:hypothetical protein
MKMYPPTAGTLVTDVSRELVRPEDAESGKAGELIHGKLWDETLERNPGTLRELRRRPGPWR